MSELKSCPFCGSDKVELYWSDHEHAIWCKNCSGGVCNWNITKDELINVHLVCKW